MERHQPQEVWAVALIIRMLDASTAVSFFRCALNIKLLVRITPRKRRVVLTRTFWLPIKIVGFQEPSFDQVEKEHTSLFSALKFNFPSWLQITTEVTTDWEVVSASSLLRAVVRIETSSTKRVITVSLLSVEARLLMSNRKSRGARTEPWGRPWVKRRLELKTLKSWTRPPQSMKK